MQTDFMTLTEQTDDKSQADMQKLRMEMSKIAQKVKLFNDFKALFTHAEENVAILAEPEEDAEIKEMAQEELAGVEEDIDDLADDIVEIILPQSDADQRDCTIEILQAAGGSESSLFAEDLFKMYQGYCRLMGFQVRQLEL